MLLICPFCPMFVFIKQQFITSQEEHETGRLTLYAIYKLHY